MKIALIVDNPKRDLVGLVLLSLSLKKFSHDVYLVPSNLRFYEIGKIQPEYVIFPNLRWPNIKLAKFLKDCKVKVGVLETEGAFSNNLTRWVQVYDRSEKFNEIVDDWFFWGENYKDEFLKQHNVDSNKVHIVGNPKFDIYQNTKISDKKKNILIATSFPFFNSNLKKASELKSRKKHKIYNDNDLSNIYSKQKNQFNQIIDIVNSLSLKYPDYIFKIRPHPFEKKSSYKKIFNNTNIVVENKELSHNAIMNNSLLIHFVSSLCFEAALASLNNIVIKDLIDEETLSSNNPLINLITFVENKDELIENLPLLTAPKDYTKLINRKIVFIDDEVLSSEKIAKILQNTQTSPVNLRKLENLKYGIVDNQNFTKIKYMFRKIFSLQTKYSLKSVNLVAKWKNSYKYFDNNDAKAILEENNKFEFAYFDKDQVSLKIVFNEK